MRWLTKTFAGKSRRRRLGESGAAAVEFALLLPFLLLLYLGAVELIQGILLQRQTNLTASTVANIVAQYTSISAGSQMPDILNASAQIFAANSPSKAIVIVSLITINSSGVATVTWSQALNGSARTTGQIVSVPTALDTPNTSLVLGETTYGYTPTIDFLHIGTKNLYGSIFMVPRASTTINLTT
jgi:Flp pilus assembly protein TadG